MDIKAILVLLFFLYVIPEIFDKIKSRKQKTEYPTNDTKRPVEAKSNKIPFEIPPIIKKEKTASEFEKQANLEYIKKLEHVVYEPKVQVSPVEEYKSVAPVSKITHTKSAWDGKINQGFLVNGLIFAEILQPPRALRPFKTEVKKITYSKHREKN